VGDDHRNASRIPGIVLGPVVLHPGRWRRHGLPIRLHTDRDAPSAGLRGALDVVTARRNPAKEVVAAGTH